jgi:SAM-dependent methyltransferase
MNCIFELYMSVYNLLPNFLFKGTQKQCNICGFESKGFLPRGHDFPIIQELEIIGAGKRLADCKKCGSTDRDRLIAAYFNEALTLENVRGKKLLHVAPEKALSNLFSKKWELDVTQADAKIAYAKYLYGKKVVTIDLCELPFAANSFDFVVVNHVLEHVSNAHQAISEIHRVLKPNGIAITQVPYSAKIETSIDAKATWTKQEKINYLGQADHQRLFGKDLENIIQSAGLQPSFWYFQNAEQEVKLGLNPKEFLVKSIKL